jgi:hypothetical protein
MNPRPSVRWDIYIHAGPTTQVLGPRDGDVYSIDFDCQDIAQRRPLKVIMQPKSLTEYERKRRKP